MKVVIAVDESPASRCALDLFLKLDFPDPEVFLVRVVESVMPDGSFPDLSAKHPLSTVMRECEESAMEELRRARLQVLGRGYDATLRLLKGSPAERLSEFAKDCDIDLVVAGRNRRTPLDDLVMGSVAGTLVHRLDRHVLVVKRPNLRVGKLTAVLAIDHSDESYRCIETFAKLAPKGVSKVHLLTVNEVDSEHAKELVHGLAVTGEKAEHWISQGLQAENAKLGAWLTGLGYDCVAQVQEDGAPAAAISDIANRVQADLIVVGAKPHGFLDRHFRRSVSEGLLAYDDRPLLMLRP